MFVVDEDGDIFEYTEEGFYGRWECKPGELKITKYKTYIRTNFGLDRAYYKRSLAIKFAISILKKEIIMYTLEIRERKNIIESLNVKISSLGKR